MNEILPCPFCACTNVKIEKWNGSLDGMYVVHCPVCGADGPAVTTTTERDRLAAEAGAVKAWNNRPYWKVVEHAIKAAALDTEMARLFQGAGQPA